MQNQQILGQVQRAEGTLRGVKADASARSTSCRPAR